MCCAHFCLIRINLVKLYIIVDRDKKYDMKYFLLPDPIPHSNSGNKSLLILILLLSVLEPADMGNNNYLL